MNVSTEHADIEAPVSAITTPLILIWPPGVLIHKDPVPSHIADGIVHTLREACRKSGAEIVIIETDSDMEVPWPSHIIPTELWPHAHNPWCAVLNSPDAYGMDVYAWIQAQGGTQHPYVVVANRAIDLNPGNLTTEVYVNEQGLNAFELMDALGGDAHEMVANPVFAEPPTITGVSLGDAPPIHDGLTAFTDFGYSDFTSPPDCSNRCGLQPVGDRLIIEREEHETETSGGIALPDIARTANLYAKVLAVSTEVTGYRTGDRIILAPFGGTNIEHEGKKMTIIGEREVLAKVL